MDGNEIAIVGIGGKFPGAKNCEEFWRLLKNGENHVKEIPKNRWDVDAFYDEDPGKAGKTYVRRAGLLDGHDEWDNKMFHISDAEAERMDPQQRYTLDCVHMALEDGGIPRRDIHGTDTGVYLGIMNDDYKLGIQGTSEDRSNYAGTGSALSIAANRVSYVFNLNGPSMCVDTACSSSLVAIHLGAQALRNGDCSMAICGGVNGILYPDIFVSLSNSKMLSPTGQCQAFSENADGYARGEGCGIVLLKKLSKAIAEGNKIYAVVYTGINQDGQTVTPITAPSTEQQKALLKTVYKHSKIDPGDIQYVEAHGTGTPRGDPVEANAIGEFFGSYSSKRDKKLKIGSVKTNIGHLESAAGVAGLIKVLLMMANNSFVPSLHSQNLNSKIDFDMYGLEVSTSTEPWISEGEEVACVNSFGFGGTNSHAVIRKYTPIQKSETNPKAAKCRFPFVVSAEDKNSVRKCIAYVIDRLRSEDVKIEDISYTSTVHREFFSYRLLFFPKSVPNLVDKLEACLQSIEGLSPVTRQKNQVIFVFCGVGTTYTGMCSKLINEENIFKETIVKIDEKLSKYTKWSVYDHFQKCEPWDDPFKAHIAIFVCQIALTELWKSWGIEPNAIIGQSVGEVAAAYSAGAITLDCAVKIIYFRSHFLSMKTGGGMAVVWDLDVTHVEHYCVKNGKVAIAVTLSKMACTVSGGIDDITHFKSDIEKRYEGSSVRVLNVKCAYHTDFVEIESLEIERNLEGMTGIRPHTKLVSTVTGKNAEEEDFVSPSYWRRNVRDPVHFYEGILECSLQDAANIFVEIGPNPVLKHHLPNILSTGNNIALSSLTKHHDSDALLSSVAELFARGINPNFKKMFHRRCGLVHLPKYIPNTSKSLYETEERRRKNKGFELKQSSHRFITKDLKSENDFIVNIDEESTPFIFEHLVSKMIVVPGALHAVVALEIGKEISKRPCHTQNASIQFLRLLSLQKRTHVTLKASAQNLSEDTFRVDFKKEMDIIATAIVRQSHTDSEEFIDLKHVDRKQMVMVSDNLYENLAQHGFEYGEKLRILGKAFRCANTFLVDIHLPDRLTEDIEETRIHPVILDGLFQSTAVFAEIEGTGEVRKFLPAGVQKITIIRHPEVNMIAFGERILQTENGDSFNLYLLTKGGSVILRAEGYWNEYIDIPQKKNYRYSTLWGLLPSSKQNDDEVDSNRMILLSDKFWQLDQPYVTSIKIDGNADMDEMIKEIERDKTSSDVIVYLCGVESTDETYTGESVFERAFSNTSALMRFLQRFITLKREIPFFICTFCTQQTENQCCNRDMNISGSELWGFVRCTIKEVAAPKKPSAIRIVDFHSNNSVEECLQTVRRLLAREDILDHSELVVCGNNIYAIEFDVDRRFIGNLQKVRENSIDLNCHVEFGPHRESDSRFTLRKQSVTTLTESDGKQLIQMENFVLHDPLIYPATIKKSEPLYDNAREIFVTFEIEGKLFRPNKNLQNDEKDEAIVVCSPMVAACIQSVPNTNVCSKSDIPFYYRGLLLETLLLLSLSDCIETDVQKTAEVFIIVEKELSREYSILCTLLAEKVHTVRKLSIDGVRDDNWHATVCTNHQHSRKKEPAKDDMIIEHSQIVVLTNLRISDVPKLLKLGTCIRSIVSFGCLLDHNVCYYLYENAPIVELRLVSTEQCLTNAAISKTLPTVLEFLEKYPKEIEYFRELPCSLFKFTDVSVHEHLGRKENKLTVEKDTLFRRDACYVVIGGTTGLGWEIAKFLASCNAGYIASISRRKPDAGTVNEMKTIEEKYGCSFKSFQADVSNDTQIAHAFEAIEAAFKMPLKGIFQGAGVLHDVLLPNMTNAALCEVMKPKILGTWNLHLLSLKHELDYFVMHSSTTSILGNIGQSNYGAGNSFMDSLAHFRRKRGLCAQSINWGTLKVGMAMDAKLEETLSNSGYKYLEKEEIINCLCDALQQNFVQAAYGIFDWHVISKSLSISDAKKFRKLGVHNYGDAVVVHNLTNIDLPIKERKQRIVEIVIDTVSYVFNDAIVVQENTKLSNFHRDSMLVMSFVNHIEDKTGVRLSISFLFSEEASIHAISEYILNITSVDTDNTNKVEQGNEDTYEHSKRVRSQCITPMEKHIYDIYQKNSRDPSLITVIDFEVTKILAEPDIWRSILKSLHAKYIALRTLYKYEKHADSFRVVKKVLESVKDVDLRVVDVEHLTRPMSFCEDNKDFYFDLENNFPLRVYFATDGVKCIIRFILNHIAIDLTSSWLIMQEMKNIGISMRTNLSPTVLPHDSQVRNYESSLKKFYRKLEKDQGILEQFWRNTLPANGCNMSLARDDITLDPFQFRFKRMELDSSKYTKLLEYLKNQNCTLFNFILTAYQILLDSIIRIQRGTSNDTIVVTSTVDLRLHLEDLKTVVMKLTNEIPFCLPRPNHDVSLGTVLRGNQEHIFQCLKNSLLPFGQITANIPSNTFRHIIVYEDLSLLSPLTADEEYSFKVKDIFVGNNNTETTLYIWDRLRKNTILLELGFSTLLISEDFADSLLHKLVRIMDGLMNEPSSLFGDVFSHVVLTNDANHRIPTGPTPADDVTDSEMTRTNINVKP
ncbi:hypothetical protein FSP39_013817 [Pinctada imbricata]|uniref:Uncharacterized protein n=1 Tax=Pinctada imbricata TaxID=66713 RepID=A0AA88Y7S2_PINIB|nr:hypothetical protein FSP39_013817 [Pinctada imbricata]